MDNRLDFISEFTDKKLALDEMGFYREKFILLDKGVKEILDDHKHDPAIARCVALARTHIETALQYTIKSLSLAWEKKDEQKTEV